MNSSAGGRIFTNRSGVCRLREGVCTCDSCFLIALSTLFLDELRVVRRRGGVRMCSVAEFKPAQMGQNGSSRGKGLSLRFALPFRFRKHKIRRRPDFKFERPATQ